MNARIKPSRLLAPVLVLFLAFSSLSYVVYADENPSLATNGEITGTVSVALNRATGQLSASFSDSAVTDLTYTWSGAGIADGTTGTTLDVGSYKLGELVTATVAEQSGITPGTITVYRVVTELSGNEDGDSALVDVPYGEASDKVSIAFTIAEPDKTYSNSISLAVGPVSKLISSTSSPASYTIASGDAVEGIITIVAIFSHAYYPALTGTAMISNMNPTVGDKLIGSLEDSDNPGILTHTWKVGDKIVHTETGETSTYNVKAGDVGKTITLEITSSIRTGEVKSITKAVVGKNQGRPNPAPSFVSSFSPPLVVPVPIVLNYDDSPGAVAFWRVVNGDLLAKLAIGEAFDHVVFTGPNVVVPSFILDTLDDTSGTLMMNTGAGVTFSISGSNLAAQARSAQSPTNLTLRVGADGHGMVGVLASPKVHASVYIPMVNREDFGFTINLHHNFTPVNAGKYANLFRWNEVTKVYDYLGNYRINEKGQAMFGISVGADYLVTVTD